MPVYTFKNAKLYTETDDLSGEACHLAAESETYLGKLDSSYGDHIELVDRLRDPVGEALQLNSTEISNMTYYDLVMYCDTIFARKFEGLDIYYNFTDDQIHDIFETNKWA